MPKLWTTKKQQEMMNQISRDDRTLLVTYLDHLRQKGTNLAAESPILLLVISTCFTNDFSCDFVLDCMNELIDIHSKEQVAPMMFECLEAYPNSSHLTKILDICHRLVSKSSKNKTFLYKCTPLLVKLLSTKTFVQNQILILELIFRVTPLTDKKFNFLKKIGLPVEFSEISNLNFQYEAREFLMRTNKKIPISQRATELKLIGNEDVTLDNTIVDWNLDHLYIPKLTQNVITSLIRINSL